MLRFARQKCHRVEFLRQVSVRRATSDGASPVIDVNVHSTDIYWGQHLRFPTLLPRSISRDQISWKILIRKGEQFNLNPPSENIYAANNSRFNALRTLNLEVRYMGRSAFIEVHIVNKPCVLLLSLQACRDLTVVPPYFPRSIKSEGR